MSYFNTSLLSTTVRQNFSLLSTVSFLVNGRLFEYKLTSHSNSVTFFSAVVLNKQVTNVVSDKFNGLNDIFGFNRKKQYSPATVSHQYLYI